MTIAKRIAEALEILKAIGMPREQLNDRTAITLLALLGLRPERKWSEATNPRMGIRGILDFAREQVDKQYAENSRESVRKLSVKQLVAAGILIHNPDNPARKTNSQYNCYQVSEPALRLFRRVGSRSWKKELSGFLEKQGTLAAEYARVRNLERVPVRTKEGSKISLSPGGHSKLIRAIIEDFASFYVPGGNLIYVGDTGKKWGYFDGELLASLNVSLEQHGKMPDVIIYDSVRNWLVLVEAVASVGPVDGIRHSELSNLFKSSTAGLVYVTAFPDRGSVFRKFLDVVAWETEVWCASDPTHLIHFNGERFLGPYAP